MITSPSSSRSGFALIFVLAVVVLLAALLVTFLARVATERTAASGYQASSSVRALADNVTSLVEAQIEMATTQGYTVSWASQPGMVRTFDSSGNLKQAFKLYSSPLMILGSDSRSLGTGTAALTALNTELTADDVPAANWASNAALWTDLNAPVTSSNGVINYPILDPTSLNAAPPSGSLSIAGFSITGAPTTGTSNLAPMPVHWLYVLQDGTLVAPTAGSAPNTVNVAGETSSNPITGRIAFWTDDDTCKININTAGEGTFWDTPHAQTVTDEDLASYQPALNEFQRYPGHPAMTCLSTVLSNVGTGSLTPAQMDQIYGLVPRLNIGGSNEGTTLIYNQTPVTPDVDRLYDNLDELIFSNSRGSNASLTRAQIEQAKFFLTAHSRAPEVNLFSLPRIACWPVYALNGGAYDTAHTTVFDRLIADCSTVNGQPYYFQRQKYNDPTNDINIARNTQLYSYLQFLTSQAVPGFSSGASATFASKYGNDRDQILTEIFDYIRSSDLYDANATTPYTPAAGAAGHGTVAPTVYKTSAATTMGFGRYYTLSEFGIGFICNADGNDTTLGSNVATGTSTPVNKVLGGIPLTAGQKYIQAIMVMEFFSPMHGWTGMQPDMQVEIDGLDQLTINDGTAAQNLFPGLSTGTATYKLYPGNVNGGFAWGANPSWRYTLFDKCSAALGSIPGDIPTSSITNYPFIGVPIKINVAANGLMTFNGSSSLVVKIFSNATSSPVLVQTININLPGGSFPIPNLVNMGTTYGTPTTNAQTWWAYSEAGTVAGNPGRLFYMDNPDEPPYYQYYISSGAFFYNNAPVTNGAVYNFDVVRTVMPANGDYRLVAGLNTVPSSVFVPHPYYNSTGMFMASNLSDSHNAIINQGIDMGGKYFPANMSWENGFSIPSNDTTAVPETTGDFDASLPTGIDGPFCNKPDEGNTYSYQNLPTNIPYYSNVTSQTDPPPTNFTPNRIMPSPGMFGSLSTGVQAGVPWRTLLFRPQANHFGATSPEDHLIMDLFWMPVVQPYAISDRFSTAGKINLNYQIVPFNYITRDTGLMALFKSEKVTAIPNGTNATTGYALNKTVGSPVTAVTTHPDVRYSIDTTTTLTQFTNTFTNSGAANFWDIYRSASQICDINIVPLTSPATTVASMTGTSSTIAPFWTAHEGTGDNQRERIYTTLYPRLTTKSNTYTVHFRVQSLHKLKTSTLGVWTEGQDIVAAEYRGSGTIERYINPNASIPDFASNTGTISTTNTLDQYYKWRVVSNHEFAP